MKGRELDALVAQARGWVKGRDELNQYDIWTAPNGRCYYDITLPSVSTDIAEEMARAFEHIAILFRTAPQESGLD